MYPVISILKIVQVSGVRSFGLVGTIARGVSAPFKMGWLDAHTGLISPEIALADSWHAVTVGAVGRQL